MERILQQITNILCTVYAPSNACLYAIRRMGVTGEKVNHKERKKELSGIDKRKIKKMLAKMMALDLDAENQVYFYYRQVLYRDMCKIF